MATGLTVSDDDISVGGRTVVGARMGRVQYGFITHTSDTALATQAGGGSQMGSAVSMVVPTAGAIRVTPLEMEFDETEGSSSASFALAVNVGGTIVWVASDGQDGNLDFAEVGRASTSVAGVLYVASTGNLNGQTSGLKAPLLYSFDIVAHSFPTGTQDVEVWLGDNVNSTTGEITVTGTTTTARFLVEIIDGS